jgi:heat shock protein HslJ
MNFRPKSLFLMAIASLAALYLLSACGTSSNLPGGDPLNGTAWSLASIDGSAPLTGTTQTAAFAAGKISGSGGCNSYGGSYSLDGSSIQIKDLVSTLIACTDPQGAMDQESAFLSGLGSAQSYELSTDKLQILTSDGKTLVFVPQQ